MNLPVLVHGRVLRTHSCNLCPPTGWVTLLVRDSQMEEVLLGCIQLVPALTSRHGERDRTKSNPVSLLCCIVLAFCRLAAKMR